ASSPTDLLLLLRHRVEAARVERMAAQEPLQREEATAPRSVARDGLLGIDGARRREPARRRQKRREETLVERQERHERAREAPSTRKHADPRARKRRAGGPRGALRSSRRPPRA